MRTKLCLAVAADSRIENTLEVSVLYVTLYESENDHGNPGPVQFFGLVGVNFSYFEPKVNRIQNSPTFRSSIFLTFFSKIFAALIRIHSLRLTGTQTLGFLLVI